ncbi:MAG: Ref family recombination enhancement nuclease [Woeseiaceae bacterium]
MSQDKAVYEKKVAQANAARQRQLEKQKAKLASPEHQKAQQEKQQASQRKTQQCAFDKMKARLDDPRYREAQQEKQRATQVKAYEKQRMKQQAQLQIKEASPEYKNHKPIKFNAIKSKGLKGRNPTALEKILGNKIGNIGCICCLNKKWYTSDMQEQESTKFVSLHHVEGRTKEWAHAKVLPLCAYHHDIPAPSHAPDELTPIHRGNKKEWIEFNGTEEELLKQVYDMIEEERPWLG